MRVAPPGLVPRASVTWVPLSVVSMLPWASSTATVTAGEIAEPDWASPGPCTKASWVAAPGVMSKLDEVPAVRTGSSWP